MAVIGYQAPPSVVPSILTIESYRNLSFEPGSDVLVLEFIPPPDAWRYLWKLFFLFRNTGCSFMASQPTSLPLTSPPEIWGKPIDNEPLILMGPYFFGGVCGPAMIVVSYYPICVL